MTTAIGNVITNMQVHAKFFYDNEKCTLLALLLGDDNTAIMSAAPDVTKLRKHIAHNFNMKSKDFYDRDYG